MNDKPHQQQKNNNLIPLIKHHTYNPRYHPELHSMKDVKHVSDAVSFSLAEPVASWQA
jgi:hypothetical protein